jgi:hypothetical protein
MTLIRIASCYIIIAFAGVVADSSSVWEPSLGSWIFVEQSIPTGTSSDPPFHANLSTGFTTTSQTDPSFGSIEWTSCFMSNIESGYNFFERYNPFPETYGVGGSTAVSASNFVSPDMHSVSAGFNATCYGGQAMYQWVMNTSFSENGGLYDVYLMSSAYLCINIDPYDPYPKCPLGGCATYPTSRLCSFCDEWYGENPQTYTCGSAANPSYQPTPSPSLSNQDPTPTPTDAPSNHLPIPQPTMQPTMTPSSRPSPNPTVKPSIFPTVTPTSRPSVQPTIAPSQTPTHLPTNHPLNHPIPAPTRWPTPSPSIQPTDISSRHKHHHKWAIIYWITHHPMYIIYVIIGVVLIAVLTLGMKLCYKLSGTQETVVVRDSSLDYEMLGDDIDPFAEERD